MSNNGNGNGNSNCGNNGHNGHNGHNGINNNGNGSNGHNDIINCNYSHKGYGSDTCDHDNGHSGSVSGNGSGKADRPIRIIEFLAQNSKILKAVQIFPENKDIVILTGKNRQGKSSVIDSIWMALGGKEHISDMPIRRGEDAAEIYLDLGAFTVTRKITEKGESLKVKNKDGFSTTSPQVFLNSLLANLAHNPLEFMRLKPQEQLKIVQGLYPLKLDRAEIERIAGTWTRKIQGDDPMLVIDNVAKALFEERTEVNRELKRIEGVVVSINIPKDQADIQPVSIVDLLAEKDRLEAEKRANDETRSMSDKLFSSLGVLRDEIARKNTEIEELEARLTMLKEVKKRLVEELDFSMDQYLKAVDEVGKLTDPDFTDINRRIAEADSQNKVANEIAQLKSTLGKAKSDLEVSRLDSQKLTDQIDALKAYKLRLISQAKLPLPGLGFEDGKVTYNGLPLDQASGREQIEISCAICLAQHPKIGIITIDVGWSELDQDGQKALSDFSRKTGAQFWVTQVREEPGHEGFHIIDGELVAVDGVPVCEDIENIPDRGIPDYDTPGCDTPGCDTPDEKPVMK